MNAETGFKHAANNGLVPDEEVYARMRLESRCLKRMKSTAAETAIVKPEMNETT